MKHQSGFSLLEVMVTIVIVSLGLLGISALIGNSLKFNQSAYARTQATWLANQIIDQMRANRTAAVVAGTSPYEVPKNSTAAPSGAPVDLQTWFAEMKAAIPSATAEIHYDNTNQLFTVTVRWDDSSRIASGARVVAVDTSETNGSGAVEIQSRL